MVKVGAQKPSAAKVQEREIQNQLDRMELDMIEQLRDGNIYEVFAKSTKFKLQEFQDFFANQWKGLKGQIYQDEQIQAIKNSVPPPHIKQFAINKPANMLSVEDQQTLGSGMVSILDQGIMSNIKSMKVQKAKAQEVEGEGDLATEEGVEPMTLGELQDSARDTINEWEQFLGDSWLQIMDAQMMSDYQSKMAEIKKEVQRLITLAKQGAIGPEFVLIALAKVNQTKNGVLVTWLGKKASHVNESMNNIANDLHGLDPGSTEYFSEMQMAQSKTRDGSYQLNLLVGDMQKVMQDVASVMEQVHGMIGEINRTRRDIISRLGARG